MIENNKPETQRTDHTFDIDKMDISIAKLQVHQEGNYLVA